jgi:hypothetical protein
LFILFASSGPEQKPRLIPLPSFFLDTSTGPLPRNLPSEHFAHAFHDTGPMAMTGLSRGIAAFPRQLLPLDFYFNMNEYFQQASRRIDIFTLEFLNFWPSSPISSCPAGRAIPNQPTDLFLQIFHL